MSLGPGFHRLSREAYLADPCDVPSLSASIAHLLVTRSPAHAWSAHPKGGGQREDPTRAMTSGTLLDSLLLGGDTDVVESPYEEYRTKEARAWRDEQLAAGRLPVKAPELRAAETAAGAILTNLLEQGIELDGENQVTAIWDERGVRCRARLDHLRPDGTILDLKILENAHPQAVARSMVSYGYATQHAAYVSAVETLRPELAGRVRMLFLAAEREPPYAVIVAHPAGSMRAVGEHRWRTAVSTWATCLASGKFPGYAAGEVEVEAPQWALAELEDTLAAFQPPPF